MKYSTYALIDGKGKSDYLSNTKIYEAEMDFDEAKITLTVNLDNPQLDEIMSSENLMIYRMRIEEHQVINFMIFNKVSFEDYDYDEKYCRLQYKIDSFMTPQFIETNQSKGNLDAVKMVLQDTYNTLASTGNIIIHEIEEN